MSNNVQKALREMFMKKKVLEMSEVCKIVRTSSKKTAYRHLKKLRIFI